MQARMARRGVWIGLAALCLLAGSLAAEDTTFTPLSMAQGNSEDHTGMWFRPDLGAAADILPLKTRISATQESVTGGVAMKVVFEKGSTGKLAYELSPTSFAAGSAGVTLYAKASRACTLLVCGVAADVGTDWKKLDFPWARLGGISPEKPGWQFKLAVKGPIDETTTLWIDRLGCEGPAFDPNPKLDIKKGPDPEISSKDYIYGADNLAGALANAKAKKPFKLLALGDSVTAGAQCNRGTWGVQIKDGVSFLYFAQIARDWEKYFGYQGITPVQHGHGGWIAAQGLNVVDKEIVDEAGPDDVVILEFGANDMGWAGKTPDQWEADVKALIDRVKTKTKNIIVLSPTPGGKVPGYAKEITAHLKDIVKSEKVCGVDVTKMLMFRGLPYAWALQANEFHPDFCGHIMLGDQIAPALTGETVEYP
ncbi:MAG: SGNH/GDSL hydrolase family protein [Planctomycetota bacterium]